MKRMLFNATHQEELRVAIVDGQKLIDLDIETAGREQRKGNIYKGVITRIEPGLEACFVNYGEERHGFLPFKEIARTYFKEGVDVRSARIQDALREGQELIVQVEKEERGNKGAALTTFVSLAGRYLVLMPNNPRGGGVSRRVEGEDRQELRETMDQLNIPQGMSIIARTAGIGRTVEELQWDLSYLMQLWTAIDGAAKDNSAPILIYLESSLVIRAIRDYFSPEIGEILIDTDDIADQATAFMSVVMPDNVSRVKRYRDDVPLFSRFQIEHQIETAYSRTVELPSGGSVVIDHTEALVAVDVNSARATRGADIEETALRTNQEAADEVARQLRLRDLGGLIVIDFIDMEDAKNQRAVENRLRDALHFDRARVQMGKISRFGLMELSRQRLRPALNEGSHITCPRCNGTGVIRDAESSALQVLRLLQEEAMKENTAAVHAQVPVDVATFLLNEKRSDITKIETRLKVNLILIPNRHLETPHHHIERLRHDDPRLEDLKTSFELVDAPSTDMSWAPKEQEVKAKPEALVKSITPAQPAPVSSTPAAKTGDDTQQASKPGLFKRLLGWLGGGASPEVKEEEPKKPEGRDRNRHSQGDRNRHTGRGQGRNRRNDNRGDNRSDNRNGYAESNVDQDNRRNTRTSKDEERQAQNRTDLANDQQGDDNNQRGRNRRGRGRNRRDDGLENKVELNEGTQVQASESAAQATPERQERQERRPAASRPESVTEEPTTLLNGPDQSGHPEEEDQGDPERKRRRRRSRRGRRGSEDGSTSDAQDQQQDNLEPVSHAQFAPIETAAPVAPVAPVAPAAYAAPVTTAAPVAVTAPVATEAPVVTAPASNEPAPVTPVTIAPAVVVAPTPVVSVQTTPATTVAEPATIVAVATTSAVVPAVTAPVAPVATAKAPLDTTALHAIVQSAGLQWVESDPVRVAEALANQKVISVKLGRAPKPVVPVSNEPLIQVETIKQI